MSRDDDADIPPELRDRLDQEGTDAERSELEDVWALLGRAAPSDASLPDAEETWDEVRRHIESEGSSERDRRASDRPSTRAARRSTRRRWVWGGAVAALLVLAIAVWWTDSVAVSAAPGTTVTRTLPDGSTVELNADTDLTYSRRFSTVSILEADRRVVRLRGEAFFEVESGERPFIVQTPTARIEVVGTAFSVRSRQEEDHATQVALAEGRLRVASRTTGETPVQLQPGQTVTLGANGPLTAVRDTSVGRMLAWRQGGFAVTARTLPAIVQVLERRFGHSIRLDSSISEPTRSDPLTLYYSDAVRLDDILYDISIKRNLTYRATADGYVLSRADDSQSPRLP